ncbi:hypothetical protein PEC18_37660 [Paucibacter sp. O1-1]|nr:hypothetical protein [Paucibacter sp. O1-1]MDA3831363.1 hypothetical protein [Paucibacter sp. O1-1]
MPTTRAALGARTALARSPRAASVSVTTIRAMSAVTRRLTITAAAPAAHGIDEIVAVVLLADQGDEERARRELA